MGQAAQDMSIEDAADPRTPPVLGQLPMEVIEAILEPLPVKDRVALASCCRALWARTDVLSSRALWGHLAFNSGRLMDLLYWRQSLCAWLARRRQALHTLYLMFVEAQTDLAAILAGLAGSSLAHLRLSYIRGGLTEARCQPLARLASSLTRLDLNHCSLAALPTQLSALSSLLRLDLSANEHALARLDLSESHSLGGGSGGEAAAAWQPLAQLGGTLTYLSLAECGLEGLPGHLTALTALQELDLAGNWRLGHVPPSASPFRPLQRIPGLRRLRLSNCHLTRLPPQLAALSLLESLWLGDDQAAVYPLQGEAALEPLGSLVRLTELSLGERRSGCGLRALPCQLSCLTALAALDLSGNYHLGRGGPEAFAPLLDLASLTRLHAKGCGLEGGVPGQLSALCKLAWLDLSCNPLGSSTGSSGSSGGYSRNGDNGSIGSEGGIVLGLELVLQPLHSLRELKVLHLQGCNLGDRCSEVQHCLCHLAQLRLFL